MVGSWNINKVKETKKRHKLTMLLLDKLVFKYSSMHKYENVGNLQNANAENAGHIYNENGENAGNAHC